MLTDVGNEARDKGILSLLHIIPHPSVQNTSVSGDSVGMASVDTELQQRK
jgi:hypothetical protein